jgi:hypothetical protein
MYSLFNDAAGTSKVTFALLEFWGVYKWQIGSYMSFLLPDEILQKLGTIAPTFDIRPSRIEEFTKLASTKHYS